MGYQEFIDPILQEFTTGPYYREVFEAKQEFFQKTGVVYEDDPEFDQRMNIFMNWYLFDRDLPGVDLPPIKYYLKKKQTEMTKDHRTVVGELCSTIHSIFRLKGLSWNRKNLVVTDLFSKKTYKVLDTGLKNGFNRGDIFEARMIKFQGKYLFSRGFCFHPKEMESFILSEIKKVRYQDQSRKTKLILQLSSMKLKHLRFQHIDVRHIYSLDSKF